MGWNPGSGEVPFSSESDGMDPACGIALRIVSASGFSDGGGTEAGGGPVYFSSDRSRAFVDAEADPQQSEKSEISEIVKVCSGNCPLAFYRVILYNMRM